MKIEGTEIRQSIDRHLASIGKIADCSEIIQRIARRIEEVVRGGGKVMTCGNGGSAAEALHLAEEMMGRFSKNRAPIAAVCLCADATALTCIANDFGYEEIFARQVEGLGRKGDVLIGLTTSGKSANVVKALAKAKSLGIGTIGLLGLPGSAAEKFCDLAFMSSVSETACIQELHLIVTHLILEYLDAKF